MIKRVVSWFRERQAKKDRERAALAQHFADQDKNEHGFEDWTRFD